MKIYITVYADMLGQRILAYVRITLNLVAKIIARNVATSLIRFRFRRGEYPKDDA
jgi:hypothetical protein